MIFFHLNKKILLVYRYDMSRKNDNINDNYQKYVISKDIEDYSQNGIKHLNIFDFLMNDEFKKIIDIKNRT